MTIAQRRAAAEQRANALLRSIVPDNEWRWEVRRNVFGQIVKREPTHLEFKGQSGKWTYRIYFHSTSENIERTGSNGYTHGICGGPYAWNDYIATDSHRRGYYPEMAYEPWDAARREAALEHDSPLSLPPSDIHLGQYLALKYDEATFLETANVF